MMTSLGFLQLALGFAAAALSSVGIWLLFTRSRPNGRRSPGRVPVRDEPPPRPWPPFEQFCSTDQHEVGHRTPLPPPDFREPDDAQLASTRLRGSVPLLEGLDPGRQ
jgi:hypothetical protein